MSDVERVRHARQLRGSIRVPGDKSASHRALMISALAAGESTITGLSPGEDVASTSAHPRAARRDSAAIEDGLVLVNGPERGLRRDRGGPRLRELGHDDAADLRPRRRDPWHAPIGRRRVALEATDGPGRYTARVDGRQWCRRG